MEIYLIVIIILSSILLFFLFIYSAILFHATRLKKLAAKYYDSINLIVANKIEAIISIITKLKDDRITIPHDMEESINQKLLDNFKKSSSTELLSLKYLLHLSSTKLTALLEFNKLSLVEDYKSSVISMSENDILYRQNVKKYNKIVVSYNALISLFGMRYLASFFKLEKLVIL